MAKSSLLVRTAPGATIQKSEDGRFLVCDSENHCLFTRSLYLAEQELDAWKADFCSLTQQLFVRSEGRSPLHLMLSFDLVGGCKPSETISTGGENLLAVNAVTGRTLNPILKG